MLNYDVKWIDVSENLQKQQQPVFFLERPLAHGTHKKGQLFNTAEVGRLGTFWTPVTPLLSSGKVEWSFTNSGEFARVPMFGYKTRERAYSSLVGTGLQLGLQAIDSLRDHTQDRVLTAILILGHEVHDMGDSYRCYIGLSLKTKE